MQIFVDMDGVLADFDTHYENIFGVRPDKRADNVDWEAVRAYKNFYRTIPPMPDYMRLWGGVCAVSDLLGTRPVILTGIPSSVEEAADNKRAWAAQYFPVEVRCCLSKEKCLHAKPGDVLIDDWEKYRHLWELKGGFWITHTSAEKSLIALENYAVRDPIKRELLRRARQ